MNALWLAVLLIHPQSESTLEKIEREVIAVVEKVRPSVVQITAKVSEDDFQARRGQIRMIRSSGFIISADGTILADLGGLGDAGNIHVTLHDGRQFPVHERLFDPRTAVAILQIRAPGLKPVEFADPGSVRQGSIAILVSNPVGLGHSSAVGFVNGLNRSISVGGRQFDDMLQTSATVQAGDAGGLLANVRGQVLGMIHSRYVSDGLEVDAAGFLRPVPREGLDFLPPSGAAVGFATPASTLRFVTDRLLKHGRVDRGWAGLGLRRVGSSVLVAELARGGPAAKAGILLDDQILEFDGGPVTDLAALRRRVIETELPRTFHLRVRRGLKSLDIDLALQAEPGP